MQRGPMYRVIYDDIVDRIRSSELQPGEQLPSETLLAKQYGVSRMTVRQAMELLGSDEFVLRKQGSGTYVRTSSRQGRRLNRLRSFAGELAASGEPVSSTTVRSEVASAPAEVAEALQIQTGDAVSRLTRVRRVGGRPAALQDAWIRYPLAPSLTREPLIEGSLYRTLAERHGVELRWADQEMTARLLPPEEAEMLGAEAGTAVLAGKRTTWSTSDSPVEFTYGWTLPSFPLLLRIEAE